MRQYAVPFAMGLLVVGLLSGSPVSAKTRIKIGQTVDGTVVTGQAASEYILSGTGGTYLSVICNAPNRDADQALIVVADASGRPPAPVGKDFDARGLQQ